MADVKINVVITPEQDVYLSFLKRTRRISRSAAIRVALDKLMELDAKTDTASLFFGADLNRNTTEAHSSSVTAEVA